MNHRNSLTGKSGLYGKKLPRLFERNCRQHVGQIHTHSIIRQIPLFTKFRWRFSTDWNWLKMTNIRCEKWMQFEYRTGKFYDTNCQQDVTVRNSPTFPPILCVFPWPLQNSPTFPGFQKIGNHDDNRKTKFDSRTMAYGKENELQSPLSNLTKSKYSRPPPLPDNPGAAHYNDHIRQVWKDSTDLIWKGKNFNCCCDH